MYRGKTLFALILLEHAQAITQSTSSLVNSHFVCHQQRAPVRSEAAPSAAVLAAASSPSPTSIGGIRPASSPSYTFTLLGADYDLALDWQLRVTGGVQLVAKPPFLSPRLLRGRACESVRACRWRARSRRRCQPRFGAPVRDERNSFGLPRATGTWCG